MNCKHPNSGQAIKNMKMISSQFGLRLVELAFVFFSQITCTICAVFKRNFLFLKVKGIVFNKLFFSQLIKMISYEYIYIFLEFQFIASAFDNNWNPQIIHYFYINSLFMSYILWIDYNKSIGFQLA